MPAPDPTTANALPLRFFLRVVNTIAVLSALCGSVGLLYRNAVGATVLLTGGILLAGLGLIANRFGRLDLAAHGLAVLLWGLASTMALLADGVAAPGIQVFATIPPLMAYLQGRRAAITWTVLCAGMPAGFFVLRDVLPPTTLTGEALVAMQTVAPICCIVVVAVTALAYDDARRLRERELEAAQQRAELANRAKSAFLATMSHEIRTPLTAVVGVAEVLDDARLGAAQRHQLDLLRGAGRTLLGLVDDVLDFSRIESGLLELEREPLDLDGLAADIAGILRPRAANRGVALEHVHTGPTVVTGDALRIRQILLNLVGNAVKFTGEGHIRLYTTVCDVPGAELLAVGLRVEDTGVGIPAARQEAIFAPFTQAEQGTARYFGGSGLGLSIVARLVSLMQGELRLDSVPGEGTTISVSLRLPRGVLAPQLRRTTRQGISGRRVLLAEDNPINQEVMLLMLQRCGYAATIVSDGFEAVEAVLSSGVRFDVILMDCQMPGKDGYQTTRELRAAGWSGPIVALTANATAADRAACMASGMDDFCSKPLTLRELGEVLARHCAQPSSSALTRA